MTEEQRASDAMRVTVTPALLEVPSGTSFAVSATVSPDSPTRTYRWNCPPALIPLGRTDDPRLHVWARSVADDTTFHVDLLVADAADGSQVETSTVVTVRSAIRSDAAERRPA